MNRAEKGWETRYKNEIIILEQKMKDLRDEMYRQFMDFVTMTSKYHDLDREHSAMQKELHRFHKRTKGGLSSDEAQGER